MQNPREALEETDVVEADVVTAGLVTADLIEEISIDGMCGVY
jgi:mycofactocin precursor